MVETLGIPLEILAKYWWLVAGGQALATSYQPLATFASRFSNQSALTSY